MPFKENHRYRFKHAGEPWRSMNRSGIRKLLAFLLAMLALNGPVSADYVCATINSVTYCANDDGSWSQPAEKKVEDHSNGEYK